jgi:hypothetical protein
MAVIDRSKFPATDDEYTASQRTSIDTCLAEAHKGPYFGPFKDGAEIEALLKNWKPKGKTARLKKTE